MRLPLEKMMPHQGQPAVLVGFCLLLSSSARWSQGTEKADFTRAAAIGHASVMLRKIVEESPDTEAAANA